METIVKENPVSAAPPKADRVPGYAWLMLGIPWFALVVGGILTYAIGVMLPSMEKDLGFDAAQAGSLSAVGFLMAAFLSIVGAAAANRLGPKIAILIVCLGSGVFYLVNASASSFTMLLVTRALALAVGVMLMPALAVVMTQWVPVSKLTMVNGIQSAMTTLGNLLATVLVPFMLLWFSGWRGSIVALGVFIFALGVLWLFLGKEKKAAAPAMVAQKKEGSAFGSVIRRKAVWLLALAWPGTMVPNVAFFTFWPSFATKVQGLEMTTAGLILGLYSIGGAIGSMLSPVLANKLGREKLFILIPGIATPITYFLMLVSPNPIFLGVVAFLTGILGFLLVAPGFSLLYKLPGIKPAETSLAISILVTFITLGATAGAIITGNLIQSTGSLYTGLAISCLGPLTLLIFGFFLPERGRKVMEKEMAQAAVGS